MPPTTRVTRRRRSVPIREAIPHVYVVCQPCSPAAVFAIDFAIRLTSIHHLIFLRLPSSSPISRPITIFVADFDFTITDFFRFDIFDYFLSDVDVRLTFTFFCRLATAAQRARDSALCRASVTRERCCAEARAAPCRSAARLVQRRQQRYAYARYDVTCARSADTRCRVIA